MRKSDRRQRRNDLTVLLALAFLLALAAGINAGGFGDPSAVTLAAGKGPITDGTDPIEPITYCWRGTRSYQDCIAACMPGEWDEDPPHDFHTGVQLAERECLAYHCPQCVPGLQGPNNRDCPVCLDYGDPHTPL